MTLCLLPQSSWAQNVSLDSLLTVAREIKVIAQQYLDDKGDTKTSANLLVAQYGRSETYNSDQWTAIAGNVPADFKALVSTDYATFPSIDLVDLPNGDVLEVPHFWACINALYFGNGDLGGWGGDLVQLAQDVHDNADVTFPSPRFSREDWVSDADAYNIYHLYPDDILGGMEQYYRAELTEAERVSFFDNGKSIATRFTTSPNYMLLYMLMYTNKVTQSDLNQAIDIFQAYIDSYLEEPEEPEDPEGNQQSLPALTITSKAAQTYTLDGRAATTSSHLRIQGHHIIWQ